MRVAITGITGMVGKKLCDNLLSSGHQVIGLVRNIDKARQALPANVELVVWDSSLSSKPPPLNNIDAVVHLAGENIFDKSWTSKRKHELYKSRVNGAQLLVDAVNESTTVKVFIGASAIGFYGDRAEIGMHEDSVAGTGFLAELCVDWEKAYQGLHSRIRSCVLRLGVVLSPDGGMLKQLQPIFNFFAGGPIGSGEQWMSWVHLDDLCFMIQECLSNPSYHGIYNAVSPEPVRNKDFSKQFARSLHRPSLLPTPEFALKLVLGERAQIALASTKVWPTRLMSQNYHFKYPRLVDVFAKGSK